MVVLQLLFPLAIVGNFFEVITRTICKWRGRVRSYGRTDGGPAVPFLLFLSLIPILLSISLLFHADPSLILTGADQIEANFETIKLGAGNNSWLIKIHKGAAETPSSLSLSRLLCNNLCYLNTKLINCRFEYDYFFVIKKLIHHLLSIFVK